MTFEQFLVYSARCGEKDDVQEMIEVTGPPLDLNYRDDTMSLNTALHMASGNGHLEIVKILLEESRINLNVLNESGNTALHYAALNGKKEIAELLISKSADANIKNEFGRIALEDALQNGHSEIAELLAPVSTLEDDKIYATFDAKNTDGDMGLFEEDKQPKSEECISEGSNTRPRAQP